ncbi:MAG: Secretion system C-terminal sorting domain [Bacteroidota bacterium]|jgi:hypothetical protein
MKHSLKKTLFSFSNWLSPNLLLVLLIVLTGVPNLSSQSSCTVANSCLDLGSPQGYTVITENDAPDFTTLITNGKLLSANLSASTPQRLIVCRKISVNVPNSYTFAPGSEIIFATSTSGLRIIQNFTLKMRSTHVHGCSVLWENILIESNARLELSEGCLVEDAVNAIQLDQGSILVSSGAEFRGNYIAIHAGQAGVTPSSIILGGVSVHSTTFSGSKVLLNSVVVDGITHTKPNMGILVENVSAIKIGVSGMGTNLFQNFSFGTNTSDPVRGIRALNSNISVANSRFINIGNPDGGFKGYGISASTTTRTHKLSVTGLGISDASVATFENVGRAISNEAVNLTMTQCRVIGCNIGVFVTRSSTGDPGVHSLDINNCRIEGICFRGIELRSTTPSRSVYIADNKIFCNSPNLGFCESEKTGIIVQNASLGSATGYLLLRNEIRGISPGDSGLKGISLESVSNLKAEQNTIIDQNISNTQRFSGISMNNCPGTVLLNNNITGNKTSYLLPETAGILNKESMSTVITCNSVNNINQGIAFNGLACDATDFKVNSIGTHNEGLFLENGTRMGDQVEKNNTWAAGSLEGKFNFPGYDPLVDFPFVQLSHFKINTFNDNSNRWANPRLIDTDNDATKKWFTGISEQPFGIICATSPKDPSRSDKLVIDGTFGTFWNLPNTGWEAKMHTYGRLYEYPELRPSGSAALTWYNANTNSSPAQLYRVMAGMRELGVMPSVTDAAAANLDALLEQRNAKENQWLSPAQSQNQLTQIKQELDALNTSFGTAQLAINTASANDALAAASQRQVLLNTLNGLTLSSSYEQDLQSVLRIILEGYATDFRYTGAALTSLTTIANKCRLEGGFAVVLARGALQLNLSNPLIDNTCGSGAVKRSNETTEFQSLDSKVFPNPTTGEFMVQWSTPSDQVRVLLTDMLGRTLQTWNTSGASLMVNDTRALTPGLYLLTVEVAGKKPETHKLLIHKQ